MVETVGADAAAAARAALTAAQCSVLARRVVMKRRDY